MNAEALISFYREWLGFRDYYSIILNSQKSQNNEFCQHPGLLSGVEPTYGTITAGLTTRSGDQRIDVPVWFGDAEAAQRKIIVFGLEPRDTNPMFNIERTGNRMFGAPFGADRWNAGSTVRGKAQNKYFRVFNDVIDQKDTFILFSDIVKFYKIIDAENRDRVNDTYAREHFIRHASESLPMLKKEISLIDPSHIITLGNDSYRFIKKLLPNLKDIIKGIRHPANGGERKAKEQLGVLLRKA